MDTLNTVIISCIVLGILCLITLGMSIYLLWITVRLEKVIKEKDNIIIKKDKEIHGNRETIEMLRDKLSIKETIITEQLNLVGKLKQQLADKNKKIIEVEKNAFKFRSNRI